MYNLKTQESFQYRDAVQTCRERFSWKLLIVVYQELGVTIYVTIKLSKANDIVLDKRILE